MAGKKPKAKSPTKKTTTKRKPTSKQALAVLTEVMNHSESDSVRVRAAKTLMDEMKKGSGKNEAKRHEATQRAEAIAEIITMLADMASAKFEQVGNAASVGDGKAVKMDKGRKTKPTDATGA